SCAVGKNCRRQTSWPHWPSSIECLPAACPAFQRHEQWHGEPSNPAAAARPPDGPCLRLENNRPLPPARMHTCPERSNIRAGRMATAAALAPIDRASPGRLPCRSRSGGPTAARQYPEDIGCCADLKRLRRRSTVLREAALV